MLATGSKPQWWLPLAAIFVPGTCYAYAAFIPSFQRDYAVAGAVLTAATVVAMLSRVVWPRTTETHSFRVVGIQGVTLAVVAIASRFWIAAIDVPPFVILASLILLYLAVWLFPWRIPNAADQIYREIWFPKSSPMRWLTRALLTLGGGAGVLGGSIGMSVSDLLGGGVWLFMAILTTVALLVGTFYLSVHIRRQRAGLSPIPASDE